MCDARLGDSDRCEWWSTWHTASGRGRPKHCHECGRVVAKGERYQRSGSLYDGVVSTDICCAHCVVVREWCSRTCGGWIATEAIAALVGEHVEDEEHTDEVSLVLVAGTRCRWTPPDGSLMPVPVLPREVRA